MTHRSTTSHAVAAATAVAYAMSGPLLAAPLVAPLAVAAVAVVAVVGGWGWVVALSVLGLVEWLLLDLRLGHDVAPNLVLHLANGASGVVLALAWARGARGGTALSADTVPLPPPRATSPTSGPATRRDPPSLVPNRLSSLPPLASLPPRELPPLDPGDLGLRVLAVDDDPLSRLVLEALLARIGCESTLVGSAHAALAALDGGRYDVVLTDGALPDVSGTELTRLVRGRPDAPPVIGVTGSASAEDRQRGLEAGMALYLTKPVTMDRLAAALAAVHASHDSDA